MLVSEADPEPALAIGLACVASQTPDLSQGLVASPFGLGPAKGEAVG